MSGKFRPIIIWLLTGAIMVFMMTVIGGITRLTESGLSMVDWNLIMGVIPPGTDLQWQDAFSEYQKFPEYQTTHQYFSLSDFKAIFFWEYTHRLLGRIIGIVFLIPFIIFIIQGRIRGVLLRRLILLLFIGAFQGFLGWYMVSSGLIHEPRVSHFRLAAHLITAFFTIAYSVWIALGLMPTRHSDNPVSISTKMQWGTVGTSVVLIIQIIFGAFVAGKDAGMIHNYWPHMQPDAFISSQIYDGYSLWSSFINHPSGIQFMHRYLAYILVILIFILWRNSRKGVDVQTAKKYSYLILIVGLQFIIGVCTLIFHVPILLASLHQLGALCLLLAMVDILHRIAPIDHIK